MLKLNINRLKALFFREFHFAFKPNILLLSVVVSVIFIGHLIMRIANNNNLGGRDEISSTIIKFGIILLIGGFLYASNAFKEFKNVASRAEYLALPASSLEKLIVKWIYTNPLFIISVSVLVFILSAVLMPYMDGLVEREYINEIFTSKKYWNLVGIYFVLHSIFFFGSIAFNKVPWLKTILSVIAIAIVVILLNALFFRIVWADMFESMFQFKHVHGTIEFGINNNDPKDMWQIKFFVFAFKYLMAPVIWVASLFKLSEKEV